MSLAIGIAYRLQVPSDLSTTPLARSREFPGGLEHVIASPTTPVQHISKREQVLLRAGVIAAILLILWTLGLVRVGPAVVS